MDSLEHSQPPGCLGEQEAGPRGSGHFPTDRPLKRAGMRRLSANTNTQHCSKRRQILGEAAASVPGSFFLGRRVPSPTSVPPSSSHALRSKMVFAIPLPESSGFASNVLRPLHKPSLAFSKSILSVCHSRRPVFKDSQRPLRKA